MKQVFLRAFSTWAALDQAHNPTGNRVPDVKNGTLWPSRGPENRSKRDGLSDESASVWKALTAALKGTAYSQDSIALEAAVSLVVRQRALNRELDANPTDVALNRISLAVGRQLASALAKFGMTPRDRQVLLVPKVEPEEPKDVGKARFFKGKGAKNGR